MGEMTSFRVKTRKTKESPTRRCTEHCIDVWQTLGPDLCPGLGGGLEPYSVTLDSSSWLRSAVWPGSGWRRGWVGSLPGRSRAIRARWSLIWRRLGGAAGWGKVPCTQPGTELASHITAGGTFLLCGPSPNDPGGDAGISMWSPERTVREVKLSQSRLL